MWRAHTSRGLHLSPSAAARISGVATRSRGRDDLVPRGLHNEGDSIASPSQPCDMATLRLDTADFENKLKYLQQCVNALRDHNRRGDVSNQDMSYVRGLEMEIQDLVREIALAGADSQSSFSESLEILSGEALELSDLAARGERASDLVAEVRRDLHALLTAADASKRLNAETTMVVAQHRKPSASSLTLAAKIADIGGDAELSRFFTDLLQGVLDTARQEFFEEVKEHIREDFSGALGEKASNLKSELCARLDEERAGRTRDVAALKVVLQSLQAGLEKAVVSMVKGDEQAVSGIARISKSMDEEVRERVVADERIENSLAESRSANVEAVGKIGSKIDIEILERKTVDEELSQQFQGMVADHDNLTQAMTSLESQLSQIRLELETEIGLRSSADERIDKVLAELSSNSSAAKQELKMLQVMPAQLNAFGDALDKEVQERIQRDEEVRAKIEIETAQRTSVGESLLQKILGLTADQENFMQATNGLENQSSQLLSQIQQELEKESESRYVADQQIEKVIADVSASNVEAVDALKERMEQQLSQIKEEIGTEVKLCAAEDQRIETLLAALSETSAKAMQEIVERQTDSPERLNELQDAVDRCVQELAQVDKEARTSKNLSNDTNIWQTMVDDLGRQLEDIERSLKDETIARTSHCQRLEEEVSQVTAHEYETLAESSRMRSDILRLENELTHLKMQFYSSENSAVDGLALQPETQGPAQLQVALSPTHWRSDLSTIVPHAVLATELEPMMKAIEDLAADVNDLRLAQCGDERRLNLLAENVKSDFELMLDSFRTSFSDELSLMDELVKLTDVSVKRLHEDVASLREDLETRATSSDVSKQITSSRSANDINLQMARLTEQCQEASAEAKAAVVACQTSEVEEQLASMMNAAISQKSKPSDENNIGDSIRQDLKEFLDVERARRASLIAESAKVALQAFRCEARDTFSEADQDLACTNHPRSSHNAAIDQTLYDRLVEQIAEQKCMSDDEMGVIRGEAHQAKSIAASLNDALQTLRNEVQENNMNVKSELEAMSNEASGKRRTGQLEKNENTLTNGRFEEQLENWKNSFSMCHSEILRLSEQCQEAFAEARAATFAWRSSTVAHLVEEPEEQHEIHSGANVAPSVQLQHNRRVSLQGLLQEQLDAYHNEIMGLSEQCSEASSQAEAVAAALQSFRKEVSGNFDDVRHVITSSSHASEDSVHVLIRREVGEQLGSHNHDLATLSEDCNKAFAEVKNIRTTLQTFRKESRKRLTELREELDAVMDYVTNKDAKGFLESDDEKSVRALVRQEVDVQLKKYDQELGQLGEQCDHASAGADSVKVALQRFRKEVGEELKEVHELVASRSASFNSPPSAEPGAHAAIREDMEAQLSACDPHGLKAHKDFKQVARIIEQDFNSVSSMGEEELSGIWSGLELQAARQLDDVQELVQMEIDNQATAILPQLNQLSLQLRERLEAETTRVSHDMEVLRQTLDTAALRHCEANESKWQQELENYKEVILNKIVNLGSTLERLDDRLHSLESSANEGRVDVKTCADASERRTSSEGRLMLSSETLKEALDEELKERQRSDFRMREELNVFKGELASLRPLEARLQNLEKMVEGTTKNFDENLTREGQLSHEISSLKETLDQVLKDREASEIRLKDDFSKQKIDLSSRILECSDWVNTLRGESKAITTKLDAYRADFLTDKNERCEEHVGIKSRLDGIAARLTLSHEQRLEPVEGEQIELTRRITKLESQVTLVHERLDGLKQSRESDSQGEQRFRPVVDERQDLVLQLKTQMTLVDEKIEDLKTNLELYAREEGRLEPATGEQIEPVGQTSKLEAQVTLVDTKLEDLKQSRETDAQVVGESLRALLEAVSQERAERDLGDSQLRTALMEKHECDVQERQISEERLTQIIDKLAISFDQDRKDREANGLSLTDQVANCKKYLLSAEERLTQSIDALRATFAKEQEDREVDVSSLKEQVASCKQDVMLAEERLTQSIDKLTASFDKNWERREDNEASIGEKVASCKQDLALRSHQDSKSPCGSDEEAKMKDLLLVLDELAKRSHLFTSVENNDGDLASGLTEPVEFDEKCVKRTKARKPTRTRKPITIAGVEGNVAEDTLAPPMSPKSRSPTLDEAQLLLLELADKGSTDDAKSTAASELVGNVDGRAQLLSAEQEPDAKSIQQPIHQTQTREPVDPCETNVTQETLHEDLQSLQVQVQAMSELMPALPLASREHWIHDKMKALESLLESHVQSVEKRLDARMQALESKVKCAPLTGIDEALQDIAKVAERCSSLEKQMLTPTAQVQEGDSSRLQALQQEVESLRSSFTDINSQAEVGVTRELTLIEERVAELEQINTTIEGRLEGNSTQSQDVEDKLRRILQNSEEIASKSSALEEKVNDLTAFKDASLQLEERIAKMEKGNSEISEQISIMKNDSKASSEQVSQALEENQTKCITLEAEVHSFRHAWVQQEMPHERDLENQILAIKADFKNVEQRVEEQIGTLKEQLKSSEDPVKNPEIPKNWEAQKIAKFNQIKEQIHAFIEKEVASFKNATAPIAKMGGESDLQSLKEDVGRVKNEVQELASQMEELAQMSEESRLQCKGLEEKLASPSDRPGNTYSSGAADDLRAIKDEMSATREEVKDLANQMGELAQISEESKLQCRDLEAKFASSNGSDSANLRTEMSAVREEVKELADQMGELAQISEESRLQCKGLEEKLTSSGTPGDVSTGNSADLRAMKDEMRAVKQEVKELADQMGELAQISEESRLQCKGFEEKLASSNDNAGSTSAGDGSNLRSLKDELNTVREEIKDLADQMGELAQISEESRLQCVAFDERLQSLACA